VQRPRVNLYVTTLASLFLSGENIMSSSGDKIKGTANEAVGNVKQAVGKATDNDRLRAEGKAQELKGDAQKAKGEVKDAIKKTIDKA
jgi:uncharacterized protein YjbJ (UPF0337 family)